MAEIILHGRPDAAAVIRRMERLLARRAYRRVNRKQFLKRWGLLRKELEQTGQYIQFRRDVIERSKGQCERDCGRKGVHVHHKKPVARFPRLACSVPNGEYLCFDCHADEHPHLRPKK